MDTQRPFVKLWEPFQVGQMTLRNRMVMPPMVTNYATEEGFVTDRLQNYYEARARGGVGLIIVEATCVDCPAGRLASHQISIDQDKFIPGLKNLVRAVHQHGARIAVQLHHAGNAAKSSITGVQPVAPSPVPRPGCDFPRELMVREIEELVSRFALAAGRAKRAGFDGVEIHAAHHYLIAQFLSSAWNKRRDIYGGELKNKARFLREIVGATREVVGQDYPVWCRINGREYGIQDGITLEETQQLAMTLQQSGIDALHVSAYAYATPRSVPPMSVRLGTMLPLAEAVKKVVSIPVMAVGKITAELGEMALREGRADLVSIGRGLITDPELPNKIASGRLGEIVPCTACNNCMESVVDWNESMRCIINTAAGKEAESRIAPAPLPKKVLIIGGGPAGMEAARIARLRGHRVLLWEQGKQLGGQLLSAAIPPHKSGIPVLTNHLVSQLEKLGVKTKLGRKATASAILRYKPDAVVIATGSVPVTPDIPGINNLKVVTAQQVLSGEVVAGERVVVIGGELVGCETAEFLADKGKKVTITRRGPRMAEKIASSARELLLLRMEAKGITMLPGVKYDSIADRGLNITTKEGERRTLEADTIVLAAGARPNAALAQALQGKVKESYLVGDSIQPRRILEAMHEGALAGLKL